MDAVATSDPALAQTAASFDPDRPDPDAVDPPARSFGKLLLWLLLGWGIVAVVVLIVAWATLATGRVNGPSMEPTLTTGDVIVASTRSTPRTGDVVTANVGRGSSTRSQVVKRVIGTEGDVVGYADCELTVNGTIIAEPYVHPSAAAGSCGDAFEPVLVSAGHVWLMGDNRAASTDSRVHGEVHLDDVRGVMLFSF